MAAINPPFALQGGAVNHPALLFRRAIAGESREGVLSFNATGDLIVTENGTPNMSVNVARGGAFVLGDDVTDQGLYFAYNDGTLNLVLAASDASNPRKDLVVARIKDDFHGQPGDTWELAVITGTPGASPLPPAVPATALVLAEVLVGAAVTSITNANITTAADSLTTHAIPVPIRQSGVGFGIARMQIFTASGTWTRRSGVRRVLVEVLGGGGGSGGAASGTGSAAACGGGAGGYAIGLIDVTNLASQAVIVGAAGAVGSAGDNPGGAGGNSSFGSVVGNGGAGGAGGTNSTASPSHAGALAAGGAASGGLVNVTGQDGKLGLRLQNSRAIGGEGGNSPYGAGGGMNGATVDAPGIAATGRGAGGSGAAVTSTGTSRGGGAGTGGIVIVWELV